MEALEGAICRFEQEHRLNEVDIVGLEASRKAAQAQYAKDTNPVALRLQVELDIQLAGKLARRGALQSELERLRAGRAARQEAEEAAKKRAAAEQTVSSSKKAFAIVEPPLRKAEQAAPFTVDEPQIPISPVRGQVNQ